MQKAYKKYLTSIHESWVTPDEVIHDVVKEGTGSYLKDKRRIISGEANEVYDITLSDGKHVILRISTSGYPNFLQEKWAIEKVRKLGVPVPEIIIIKHLTVGGKEKSFCLMEKVDGEPLERGNIDFDKLNPDLRESLINQAGEILSKIHQVETQGFGWIIGEGRAKFNTSKELVQNLLNKQEAFEKMAKEENIEKSQIIKALDIIKKFSKFYSKVAPCLNHGDFSHKHFMVKGNKQSLKFSLRSNYKIVAVLDWGGVRSDTPIYDFANWDYWFGEYIPTEWLKEGYKDKSLFSNNFNDFLHMLRLFKGLEILHWYHEQKYKPAVQKAKAKLLKDLKYFGHLHMNI